MSEESEPLRNLTLEAYTQALINCEFDNKSRDQVANDFGVTRQTLCNWDKKLDWEWVKTERRKRYAEKIIQVDDAMFKAAKKGDVAAAKVIYERFDGWIPSQRQLNHNSTDYLREISDEDLQTRALEIRRELDAKIEQEKQATRGITQ